MAAIEWNGPSFERAFERVNADKSRPIKNASFRWRFCDAKFKP
jgi:hypothetical protein